jgi:hypothetical protein
METSVTIPGVAGPVSGAAGMWGLTIKVAGQPVPRSGRNVTLPGLDGQPVAATLRSNALDPYPVLRVAGVDYATGPRPPMWLKVLAVLPFALIAVGGLLGGVFGVAGVIGNWNVLRSERSLAVKAAIAVAVLAAAVLAWLLVVSLILRR